MRVLSCAWLLLLLSLASLVGCTNALIARPSVLAPNAHSSREEPISAPSSLPAALPEAAPLERYTTSTLPGGLRCLLQLDALGIPHRHLGALRGVETPVEITGPLGGLLLRGLSRRTSLICDCRLALALHRSAPYLLALGVRELLFSGAYSYRLMPSGKPSRHALGLAIDVHEARAGDEHLTVGQHYELGLEENGCGSEAPLLNRLACLLGERGFFDFVLTPDFDRAHYNHLHLDIAPLRGEAAGELEPAWPAELPAEGE